MSVALGCAGMFNNFDDRPTRGDASFLCAKVSKVASRNWRVGSRRASSDLEASHGREEQLSALLNPRLLVWRCGHDASWFVQCQHPSTMSLERHVDELARAWLPDSRLRFRNELAVGAESLGL